MKYSIVAAVAAFAGVAQAQSACLASAQAIPPCALGYLASAASSIGNCGLVDFACQCSNSASVQAAIAGTVAGKCSDIQGVINSAGALCSCVSANSGQSVQLTGANSQCVSSAAAIPPCALGYLASAANSIGNCALTDFACQCSNSASVQAAIAQTVAAQCSDINPVIQSANALCSCVAGAGGSSGGGSSGGSGSGSSAAATTGSGSSGSSGSKAASGSMPAATGGSSGSGSGTGASASMFTGGAAAPVAVGGVFGAVVGALALL